MARRMNVNEINLSIKDVIPFSNERRSGFIIEWSSDIGFGEYTIYQNANSNEWQADSECMDSNEDKDFVKKLMSLFVEQITIDKE